MPERTWQDVAAQKQKERDELIPARWRLDISTFEDLTNVTKVPIECGILSAKQIDITTNYDAIDLLELIRDSTFTVEDVVTAFCARAAIAQQLVCSQCLSFFTS